ncbi:phage tail tip lysozyme, partial [Streptococcus oralis]|uniref:phage tail tip lysozyme n=1 Tax=Streptococcus oralis TaxID=1303 RepID=UPI002109042B
QWTDTADGSTRHTLLLNYPKSKNKKWYDLELQLDFMLEGDTPYYITELTSILTSTENVESLTERFLVNWEGNSGDKVLERQNNSKQIHAFLTQQVRG